MSTTIIEKLRVIDAALRDAEGFDPYVTSLLNGSRQKSSAELATRLKLVAAHRASLETERLELESSPEPDLERLSDIACADGRLEQTEMVLHLTRLEREILDEFSPAETGQTIGEAGVRQSASAIAM